LIEFPSEDVEMERWKKIAAALGNRTPVQVRFCFESVRKMAQVKSLQGSCGTNVKKHQASETDNLAFKEFN
jgi:hypothetical protein